MDILLTGSVAYDYLMTFPGHFKEQILPERLPSISLSFLVDSMSKQRGGIAPNIAYTMALLGEKPRVMATVGEDFLDYRNWLEAKGVDTSLMKVVPGEFTASFFATTDRVSGQIASFYPGAMGYSATQSIKELDKKPDLVIVSPSAPDAMKKFPAECRELGISYLYDPSQQVLRLEGNELARDMEGAHFLFCNDYEFGLISKKTGWSLDQILDHVIVLVITRGKDGADLYMGGDSVHIPTVPEDEIVKFAYGLWRPHHAIRLADTDGNPDTEAHPGWSALILSPRFPEYIANHASLTGAFMHTLARLLGDEHGFTLNAPNYPSFAWTFERFSDAAVQAGEARIWAGIHYRHSCDVGQTVGRTIADHVLDNFLLPLR